MDITFADKKLKKIVSDERAIVRVLGKIRAEKMMERMHQLRDAITLEDVRYLPGNYHELTGDRKGQWACDLDQPYRLVFEPQDKPIPVNEHGQYIWVKIIGVEIIEIVNYHKEK
ncbi:MAG: type II toxin-antitoxin system RelE/ParE family toxin [Tannerella sp.]|jgi:proteic killer suppression protein|nr:type II toxin-antitoxin system RelE/ParE family toxin [Tannerella sp.]